ncbi:GNAT family N-acetyltransferase [Massilia niastensis]|uniref:GNAT family N-acetyltransferase n=1 Tax=Massilia niastensis TaxID=544911 RepID=UPI00037BB555|nr:GNAT family N-acetyltransferase [Massilia niastensis]
MSGILIRDYAAPDRDGVNAVARAAFLQYEGEYEEWTTFIAGIGRMAELAQDAGLVVAERAGRIVGAVAHIAPGRPRSAIFPEEWSVIRMLVVDPAHRGHGIGRGLVAACLQRAQRANAPAIGLHTSPIMASALRLYGALGFERDRDLPPIRGVPYGRYVLPAARIPAALELLADQSGPSD